MIHGDQDNPAQELATISEWASVKTKRRRLVAGSTKPRIKNWMMPSGAQSAHYHLNLYIVMQQYLITYSMEQSPPWEANWFCSLSRNSPHFWNPKVHHRTHKCPPPVPIMSQLHPVLTNPSHFLKIHLNIILPSMSGPPQWSLSLRFPHQNPVHPSPLRHTCHMTRPSHSSQFYHPHNIR